jgi:hypothetical protein
MNEGDKELALEIAKLSHGERRTPEPRKGHKRKALPKHPKHSEGQTSRKKTNDSTCHKMQPIALSKGKSHPNCKRE